MSLDIVVDGKVRKGVKKNKKNIIRIIMNALTLL